MWRRIQQFASEVKKTPQSSNAGEFLFHAELSFVSLNIDSISRTSFKKVNLKRSLIAFLFVFFLHTTC
jgi:hypothetical protein